MSPLDIRNFDLVIIGAGPAGAAAVVTARQKGLTVALLDKAEFPRDKLCGGLITGRNRMAFCQIFGDDISPDLFEMRHNNRVFHGG
ncbi:Geranylgeranyl/isoprenyl reductase [hydrothermal vent metagenome]|uniref:Geranylgeranyl/isoprenyl reductase n=1 Tax=hydrothermal vent metagenome TaxID=652676 RepID=A0A3B0RC79_9ZZZZ